MKPVTRPLVATSRGASARLLGDWSKNVAADLANQAAEGERLSNRFEVMMARLDSEVRSLRSANESLMLQIQAMTERMASRGELEDLAVRENPSGALPQDRGYSHIHLAALGAGRLSLSGLTREFSVPGGALTLPLSQRRSLVFGNDPVTGLSVLPEDLSVEFIAEDEGQPMLVESTSPRLALTDSLSQPFLRRVRLGTADLRERIQGRLEVTIPASVRGSLRLNLVEVVPVPAGRCSVERLEFYSASGGLLHSVVGPWDSQALISLPAGLAVARAVVVLSAHASDFEHGGKVFSYGLGKLGFYEAQYADSGEFTASVPLQGKPATRLMGLEYNTGPSSVKNLVSLGALRLQIEVEYTDNLGSWATVFASDSFRSGYAAAATQNSYFPEGGVALRTDVAALRLRGSLRMIGGVRPQVCDLLVTYAQ